MFHALAELQNRSMVICSVNGQTSVKHLAPDSQGIIFIRSEGHHYSKLRLIDSGIEQPKSEPKVGGKPLPHPSVGSRLGKATTNSKK